MFTQRSSKRQAFTLIELLVVIAIIAILAAILFPVFAQAKAAAKKTNSLSNQKQIGIGSQLYASDYDDMLPETGWAGPCSLPVAPWTSGNDNYSGVQGFTVAQRPYMKNDRIMVDPADPNPGVHGKTGEGCFEQMFIAGGVPGAFVGMQDVPGAFNKALPASYGGNYLLMPGYDTAALGGAGNASKGRSMTALASPANIFFSTEVGSVFVPTYGTYFSGWYTVPGYGNGGADINRWSLGARHTGGRNWTFADGHAKYLKDPSFKTATGGYKGTRELIYEYQQRGLWTYWETTSSDYCQFPVKEAGCAR